MDEEPEFQDKLSDRFTMASGLCLDGLAVTSPTSDAVWSISTPARLAMVLLPNVVEFVVPMFLWAALLSMVL
jgi:hypothetical protein